MPYLLALLGLAGFAHGQAAEPPEPMPVEESTEVAESDGSDTATVRLPPVVVTARKWEENLLDVPQSVTVIPDSLIEDASIRSMRDTAVYVPNVVFTEFSAQRLSFPFVRGIGSGQGDPAVTTYVDGVPQLSISSTNLPLLDVERIEFLRGPQGTLYGRNSLGGLIHVITKRPSNTTEFDIGATFGNYNLQEYRLRFSGPIIEDELFVSLSGMRMSRDGYTDNDFTGNDVDTRDVWFGRADVLWTPDERNDVRFSVYGEDRDDGGFVLSELNGLKRRPHHISQDFEGRSDRDLVQPSLTWTHSGDMIDFTTISAFQTWDIDESSDFDFSALDGVRRFTDESLDGFTQEVRLSSAEDAPIDITDEIEFKWLAGLLAFTADSDRSAINEFRPGGVPFLSPVPGRDRSKGDFDEDAIGVFGQATVTIAQNLDLTAGLRYDYESKDADITRTFSSGGFTTPLGSADEDESFDEFLPRFDVAYRIGEEITLYGLAAKGFKAGGFNLSAPPGDLAFDQETSWTYEGGVKTSFLDDRLRVSAAYFYIDWDDMQLSQFDAMSGGYITNAGESTSQGVELELSTRPVEGLDIFATFGYTDTEFDEFVDSYGVDVSGNDLPFAPDTTWSVGAQYSGALGRSVQFFVRGEYLDVGELFYDAGNRENERFAVANLSAGVSGHNWRLQGWIRNALQDDYVPVAFQPSPVDPTVFVGESGSPRTYGVTLSLTF